MNASVVQMDTLVTDSMADKRSGHHHRAREAGGQQGHTGLNRQPGIIDTHFHIWNFDLRRTYKKTDGSFDWPDESLPEVRVR